ncbi:MULTISPECIES: hypothetical protein [unclassified Bradyrhizobium]|uniref:hypothetical protein n=1 Tax=unclassified Bradyrhizobium TaxID=2631580 RepID=UPI0029166D33|nr:MULTISPECIES: hypothetical protein [unclassified Bradyrhizobium]
MTGSRKRFAKIVAIAMDPGAFEDEAIAALRKARELVRQDPTLKHPEINPPQIEKPKASFKARISNVDERWLTILMSNLSEEAYGLGLRSKIACDFSQTPIAVEVRCDGEQDACNTFEAHADWLIDYINKTLSEK